MRLPKIRSTMPSECADEGADGYVNWFIQKLITAGCDMMKHLEIRICMFQFGFPGFKVYATKTRNEVMKSLRDLQTNGNLAKEW